MKETVDFGAPSQFGMHHFYIEIPATPKHAISIYEDFGFDGDDTRRETTECRVVLARELWSKIKSDARRDFNARLKAKKMSTGSWKTGKVKLDRFLGRELCVLAWATEHASLEQCAIITAKWLALRPEERWWLYTKTAAGCGLAKDTMGGWRKALYCALSDGENINLIPKVVLKTKPSKAEQKSSLFDFVERGDI